MIPRRSATAALALALTLGVPVASAAAAPSSAPSSTTSHGSVASTALASRPLAELLLGDGNTFDRNWYDYDIVTEAALAVLAAKPTSPVGVLTTGDVALTAFLPNDRAFQVLTRDLTGRWIGSEQQVFSTLAETVGVDAIEKVLLYHVVPGVTIDSRMAVRSDRATLATAQGGTITVDVIYPRWSIVRLVDKDRNDSDPFLNPWALDLNKGNKQIAHGITLVLRPLDL